jgi:aminoglycoside phosphotransferase (APT) family kinase protein
MHGDQLDVAVHTVRALVVRQFPQWANEPVRRLESSGTVNAIFRLGDGLAVRFPLRAVDPGVAREQLRAEAEAAAEFAAVSTVPSPVTVAIGAPGEGYPLPWSVQTWIPGDDAVAQDPAGSEAFAHDLVALIERLRGVDPRGRRFSGAGRGGHLRDHDDWVELCLDRSAGLLDVASLRAMWAELRQLPEVDDDRMCHGDLTPPNVLVRDGRLAGVLDTGGFGPADPALDLVSAWHLLDDGPRRVMRDALRCSDVQWRRGMAWALQQALGLVWYYAESNPTMSAWGGRTLDRLVIAMR